MLGIERENRVIVSDVKDFNVDQIFNCGQCFRFYRQGDGSYTGVAFSRVLNVKFIAKETPHSGELVLTGTTPQEFEDIWRSYFDLERNYDEIKKTLCQKDPIMKRAVESGEGIRILRQDIWETVVSFIISQNNNIPRIRKCIERICEEYGDPIPSYDGRIYYTFPTALRLASLTDEEFSPCKLGYRASYILKTAKQFASQGEQVWQQISKQSEEEAKAALLSLNGVGPKVASCILLFSMGKYESFPVDVWVRRVMNQLYHIDEKDTAAMTEYAALHFGRYGGIAQQYLFYYIRQLSQES